jgi:hypothetical protein
MIASAPPNCTGQPHGVSTGEPSQVDYDLAPGRHHGQDQSRNGNAQQPLSQPFQVKFALTADSPPQSVHVGTPSVHARTPFRAGIGYISSCSIHITENQMYVCARPAHLPGDFCNPRQKSPSTCSLRLISPIPFTFHVSLFVTVRDFLSTMREIAQLRQRRHHAGKTMPKYGNTEGQPSKCKLL